MIKELIRKIVNAGFELERITSFMSFLFPLFVLSRLCNRTGYEFRISKIVNVMCMSVCQLERKFIHLGLNFPLGGSLLCVAKKPLK